MVAQKANYPVSTLCRVLRVSRSAVYQWPHRSPARRLASDIALAVQIGAIHRASRGTYGSPRVQQALRRQSVRVGRKRVARLMAERQLYGRRPPRGTRTTHSEPGARCAPNVLARDFTPAAPDRVWAADITYVWTAAGWLYLAVVLDLYARRVVGWAMADHLQTALALEALTMALRHRRPTALLHHSDRGVQYTSAAYQQLLQTRGIRCSMSRRGNCWDNAVVESFFATLKAELLTRRTWATRAEAQHAIVDYIEGFYNRQRLHSALRYRTPVECEKEFHRTAAPAA